MELERHSGLRVEIMVSKKTKKYQLKTKNGYQSEFDFMNKKSLVSHLKRRKLCTIMEICTYMFQIRDTYKLKFTIQITFRKLSLHFDVAI